MTASGVSITDSNRSAAFRSIDDGTVSLRSALSPVVDSSDGGDGLLGTKLRFRANFVMEVPPEDTAPTGPGGGVTEADPLPPEELTPPAEPITGRWESFIIEDALGNVLADASSDEALIEEIQNDRLREVRDWVDHIRSRRLDRVRIHGVEWPAAFLLEYWNVRLRLARAVWDEAITCAAIRLIVSELGIRRIWFHTPESGRLYKSIAGSGPPRSVYMDLPRKFCFRPVSERPAFLHKARRRANDVGFQLLEI